MRAQINFADTRVFKDFMQQLDMLPLAVKAIIHGVFIDVHPTWTRMANVVRFTDNLPLSLNQYLALEPLYEPSNIDGQSSDTANDIPQPTRSMMSSTLKDGWDKYWETYRVDRGSDSEDDIEALREPLIVKVYVVPTTPSTLPLRRTIEDLVQRQPFFAAVEDKEIATLAAINVEGGIDIIATTYGSLGGFLQDRSGSIWGVTCGHVAQNVGASVTFEDVNHTRYPNAGTVRHTNFPFPAYSQSTLCNPYGNTQTVHSDTDAALFEVTPAFSPTKTVKSVGPIDLIHDRLQLSSGTTVRLGGGVSGAKNYVIGAYGVTCKIQVPSGGLYYCFKDLFEIYAPVRRPGGVIGQTVTPRPLPGDSGSWICHNHSGSSYAYFGNLIAVQGLVGIATFADSLQNWARRDPNIGLDLRVLP